MKHVELHVGEAHPDMELTPDNVAMVKGLVRTTLISPPHDGPRPWPVITDAQWRSWPANRQTPESPLLSSGLVSVVLKKSLLPVAHSLLTAAFLTAEAFDYASG
jgi:hypothetical protein